MAYWTPVTVDSAASLHPHTLSHAPFCPLERSSITMARLGVALAAAMVLLARAAAGTRGNATVPSSPVATNATNLNATVVGGC